MRFKLQWAAISSYVIGSLAGCSGGDSPSSPTPPPPPPPEVGVRIGVAGGNATFENGDVVLVVPPGAVTGDVSITVDPVASPLAPEHLLDGTTYEFGPDGTQFAEPVRLTLAFDVADLPEDAALENIKIGRFSGSTWEPLATSVDVDLETGIVSGDITSFSVWSAMHQPCTPVALWETQRTASLSNEDCFGFETGPARWVDYWTPLRTSSGMVRLTVTSSKFDPHIGLEVNDRTYGEASGSGSATFAIGYPNDVTPKFWISSIESLGEGPYAYTVKRESLSASHTLGCDESLKVVPGYLGTASLSTSDCLITIQTSPAPEVIGEQVYEEYYRVAGPGSVTVVVTRTGGEADFRPFLTVWSGVGVLQGDPDDSQHTITFEAGESTLFGVSSTLRYDEQADALVPTTGSYRVEVN